MCFAQNPVLPDSIMENEINRLIDKFSSSINKDISLALPIVDEMFNYSTDNNFQEGLGISYGNYGIFYAYNGDQAKSTEYFIKSAEVFEAINNDNQAAVTNTNIGVLLLEQNQFEEAKIYFEKAMDYFNDTGRGNGQSNYIGLGLINLETNKGYEETISKFKRAEELSIEKKDTINLSSALCLQGATYLEYNKNIEKADELIKKSLFLTKKHSPNDNHMLGKIYNYFARYHYKKGNLTKALKFSDSSIYCYKTLDYYKGLKFAYQYRKDILTGLGRYNESIEVYESLIALKDSLFQKDKLNQTVRMQTRFETEDIKRQKETAEKNAEINALQSNKNKSLFIGSVLVAGLILLSSLFYFGRAKANRKAELVTLELKETQKRLALEKQYRQSELKALKAQMDPHFIFNALNSIQEYIVLNQKNLASDYLSKFAGLMRKYLHHSDKGAISIKDEVNCLDTYLELEKVRFEDTLNYTIEVSKDIDIDSTQIPTMIIQPYVENALKHGLLHKKDNRRLEISLSQDDNYIKCIVKDNGVGRARSKEIKDKRSNSHQSFATKANQNRLELLNFDKDKKIGVETVDLFDEDKNPIGTKVVMKIPYSKEF